MREFLYEGNLLDWIRSRPILRDAMQCAGGERPDYLASLYKYCRDLLPNGALVVEIGTYLAESTVVMGHALKQHGGRLITIDPVFMTGEYISPDAHNKQGNHYRSTVLDFERKIRANRLHPYVSMIPTFSENVLSEWDCPIDAVVVDGEHTYQAIQHDCGWLRWVKPGGYAIFDDWFNEIERSVKDFISDKPEWTILHESTWKATEEYCVTILQKSKENHG